MKHRNAIVAFILFPLTAQAQWERLDGWDMDVADLPDNNRLSVGPSVLRGDPPENNNGCDGFDTVITFSLTSLKGAADSHSSIGWTFDVNNLRFAGTTDLARSFLEEWQEDIGGDFIPPINGYDWSSQEVSFCVGSGLSRFHPILYNFGQDDVVIWYDQLWAKSKVANIAWQPRHVSCEKAIRWAEVDGSNISNVIANKAIGTVDPSSLCASYGVPGQCAVD